MNCPSRLLMAWLLLCLAAVAQTPKVAWRTTLPGYGQAAATGDEVAISYTLRLRNGEIIDATPQGQSYRMTIGSTDVLVGMSQGIAGMQRGETRELEIPPELGYGGHQVGPIPADSTLLFEVKMLFFAKQQHDDLSTNIGKEGFENRPDARTGDKPAVFEYLIRDFFSKPWRYPDSPALTWQVNGVLTLVALALWGACSWLERRKGQAQ